MKKNRFVYLDNAATTWPKPPEVLTAMNAYLTSYGAVPGRSGHAFSIMASREVFETRELIAGLFNVPDSERVIFTLNATHAINYALKGFVKKGAHIISSCMEHNAVMRPLKYLERIHDIDLDVWPVNESGVFETAMLEKLIKPNTKAIITTHASNITGQVLPLKAIGEICKKHGITFIADLAQTAGIIPIDMQSDGIDMLVFSGHKKLYGPPGTGGLCLEKNVNLEALFQGGSGSQSERDEHPSFYPDRLEAGTLNTVGIVGLKAGITHINTIGIQQIREKLIQMRSYFLNQLLEIEELEIYDTSKDAERTPVISFNIMGVLPSETSMLFDRNYGILCRAGLHCAPIAHKTLGTFPFGTVRVGLGIFNTSEEIDYTVNAIKDIILQKRNK